jgi:hypothetical protein
MTAPGLGYFLMKNPDLETVRPEYFCRESAAGMPELDLNLVINKRFEAFDELPPVFFTAASSSMIFSITLYPRDQDVM